MIKLFEDRHARTLVGKITALFCFVLIGFSTLTTNALAQSRTPAGGKARIYVLRGFALPGAIYDATITLNDVKVGAVANGSYVSIDRPPGRYTMKVRFTALDLAPPEYTFHAKAGRIYYFSLNSAATPILLGGGAFFVIPGSNMGKPVGERNVLFSSFHIGELDAAAGAAELVKFKAR